MIILKSTVNNKLTELSENLTYSEKKVNSKIETVSLKAIADETNFFLIPLNNRLLAHLIFK
jgi:hypothetical protein